MRNKALYVMVGFMLIFYIVCPLIGMAFNFSEESIFIPLFIISIFIFPALAAWVDATVDSKITLIAIPLTLLSLLVLVIIIGLIVRNIN